MRRHILEPGAEMLARFDQDELLRPRVDAGVGEIAQVIGLAAGFADQDLRRARVQDRNLRWDTGNITREVRSEAYGHHPSLVLIGGPEDVRKADFAKKLEQRLFDEGCKVYYLGIRNVLAGLDSDMTIKRDNIYPEDRDEMVRRMAELANILLDAGIILITTVSYLSFDEREAFRESVAPVKVRTLWVGNADDSDVDADFTVMDPQRIEEHLDNAVQILKEKGVGR